MASFQLLEPSEEDELHKTRLLNVEEKTFKRVSRHLLGPSSLLTTPSRLPTSPDFAPGDSDSLDAARQNILEERRQFKDDILFDFSAFDSYLTRIQFLRNSNQRERERYRKDKARILETAQHVRDSNAQLRIHLEEAKQTLEQRKKFDELAEKITGNRLLRPREDQMANLSKLEEECRELERESKSYKITWAERREQFGRIVEEGMQLRRLIRDEKEEVERREGMADNEDIDNTESTSRGDRTPRSNSGNGTPKYSNSLIDTPDKHGRSESRSKNKTGIAKINLTTNERNENGDDDDFIMEDVSWATPAKEISDATRNVRGDKKNDDKMDLS